MNKHERMQEFARQFEGQGGDPRYAGYFVLFNRQRFYEAHDVLEDLWLEDKKGPDGDFYKGLIQLAGAFVHLQKGRLRPADAVFKLAQSNLKKYPREHQRLNLAMVSSVINDWRGRLERGAFAVNPLDESLPPRLNLL